MKLCVLTHLFPVRSETFIREHVIGMASLGYDVTVIARDVGEGIIQSEIDEFDTLKINRVYLGSYRHGMQEIFGAIKALITLPKCYKLFLGAGPWPRGQLLLALDVARSIDELQPDVLHIHFGTLAAKLVYVRSFVADLPPVVVTWHGYDANAIPRSLGRGVYESLFATNWIHTVGNDFMRQRLLTLGAESNRVVINPMGVSLRRFTFSDRGTTKETDALKILSVGRLDEVKGHGFLIDAVHQLRLRGLQTRLRIVGEGPLKAELESKIEGYGLSSCVDLLGGLTLDQVAGEMRYADLFALASVECESGKVESQGLVFAEAQAAGLPVVSCDVGGVSHSVIHGETGLLCKSRDSVALAEAIEVFAHCRSNIQVYGERGRRFVEKNFSLQSMLENFEKVYRRARLTKVSVSQHHNSSKGDLAQSTIDLK